MGECVFVSYFSFLTLNTCTVQEQNHSFCTLFLLRPTKIHSFLTFVCLGLCSFGLNLLILHVYLYTLFFSSSSCTAHSDLEFARRSAPYKCPLLSSLLFIKFYSEENTFQRNPTGGMFSRLYCTLTPHQDIFYQTKESVFFFFFFK